MDFDAAVQRGAEALYLLIFVLILGEALRYRRPAVVATAIFFGASASLVLLAWATALFDREPQRWLTTFSVIVLLALPYLLFRITRHFTRTPRWLPLPMLVSFIIGAALFPFLPSPLPGPVGLLYLAWWAGTLLYCTVVLAWEGQRLHGVSRRRLWAAAFGAGCLAASILVSSIAARDSDRRQAWTSLAQLLALASGVGFFAGFTPPRFLRHMWQGPELRAFLTRLNQWPDAADEADVVRSIERSSALTVGTAQAVVSRWDEERGALRSLIDGEPIEHGPAEQIAGRAFSSGRPVASFDAARDDPAFADHYRRFHASTVLAAPITAGRHRLGVLTLYGPHAPLFIEDDLLLVQLLADVSGLVLETRGRLEREAQRTAQGVIARLKDDFLSSAAHDLRTPLTVVMGETDLLRRMTRRRPAAPVDEASLERLEQATQRLNYLVNELVDFGRVESGRLIGERESVDLVAIAIDVCQRLSTTTIACNVEAEEPLIGQFDRHRIFQLLENLAENAVKFSPNGGKVETRLWREGDTAHITVIDHGVGIAASDLPHLFEGFYRGANANDRQFPGMGLGLYICRGIVEQHGGQITIDSQLGEGSLVHVALPLTPAPLLEPRVAETEAFGRPAPRFGLPDGATSATTVPALPAPPRQRRHGGPHPVAVPAASSRPYHRSR